MALGGGQRRRDPRAVRRPLDGTPARRRGLRPPLICLDIFPTAAAAAGAALPAGLKLDGANLLPHLLGENKNPPHENLYWRIGGGRSGALRSGRYKIVKVVDVPAKLFDLESDIGEPKDLSDAEPQRAQEMLKRYEAWNAQLAAPLWESPRPARKK